MNPYYTVFFAPAIEPQLRLVGEIYRRHGYIDERPGRPHGRALGQAVRGECSISAGGLVSHALRELPGFTERRIERALAAARRRNWR